MLNLKKTLSIKITSLIVVLTLFVTSLAYCIELPERSYLRVPLLGNSDEGRDRLARIGTSYSGTNPGQNIFIGEEKKTFLNVLGGAGKSAVILLAGITLLILPALAACVPESKPAVSAPTAQLTAQAIIQPTQTPRATGAPLTPTQAATVNNQIAIVNWINANVATNTGLPLSFRVPKNFDWNKTLDADHRIILKEGLVLYDAGLAMIVWANTKNIAQTDRLINVLWKDSLGEFKTLRAYYDPADIPGHPFIYRDPRGNDISPFEPGKRGYIFKIINAEGHYRITDPLTGKQVTWQQWQPISGENSWFANIGTMHTYYSKYGLTYNPNSLELKLAEEVARAALLLQADDIGGIRMAPIGTSSEGETGKDPLKFRLFYDEISTENNLSGYAGLRMLAQVTGKAEYKKAMSGIEAYFKWAYVPELGIFAQGAHFYPDKGWVKNTLFATDVQTWAIDALGPDVIDAWFGEGTAYRMWQKTKELAGVRDSSGRLIGLDFADYRAIGRQPLNSGEWTGGGITGVLEAAKFYAVSHPDWADELQKDAEAMRLGMESLRLSEGDKTGYSYFSCVVTPRECPANYGWYSPPEVGSLASTAWAYFVDTGFNPFFFGGKSPVDQKKKTSMAAPFRVTDIRGAI
ncbi:MAG: hypothetical protein Q7O04_04575 [Candidatus Omnitrophota bacterium]|nr:hypothetical protein [Candidatus Omnitrophota bacterium]